MHAKERDFTPAESLGLSRERAGLKSKCGLPQPLAVGVSRPRRP